MRAVKRPQGLCEKELPSRSFVAPSYRVARRYRSLITCRFVIVLSFAPGARDTELLALRFVTRHFRFRADHLASVRSRPFQHSLPAASVLLCPGSERSTVFARATTPAQSEQPSRSFVSRSRLTNQPTRDSLCAPPV